MPGLTAALASLEDVLEVQGSSLCEAELWSILCLCAEALQDILFKGTTSPPPPSYIDYVMMLT